MEFFSSFLVEFFVCVCVCEDADFHVCVFFFFLVGIHHTRNRQRNTSSFRMREFCEIFMFHIYCVSMLRRDESGPKSLCLRFSFFHFRFFSIPLLCAMFSIFRVSIVFVWFNSFVCSNNIANLFTFFFALTGWIFCHRKALLSGLFFFLHHLFVCRRFYSLRRFITVWTPNSNRDNATWDKCRCLLK